MQIERIDFFPFQFVFCRFASWLLYVRYNQSEYENKERVIFILGQTRDWIFRHDKDG